MSLLFLTDFGKVKELDEAPIIFCSPTDYDDKHPEYGNILFANNFIDFVTIMTQITYAEMIRFQDPRVFDFTKAVEEIKRELSENEIKTKSEIISYLGSIVSLNIIEDYNKYYQELYSTRSTDEFIPTKDRLNIKFENIDHIEKLNNPLGIIQLDNWLSRVNKESRLKFYRDATTIYPYYKDEFLDVVDLMLKHLEQDNLRYEAKFLTMKRNQKL